MESTETNMPLFIGITAGIVAIFVVVAIVSYLNKKKRIAASWEGTVIDKAILEDVHQSRSDRDRRPNGLSSETSIMGIRVQGTNVTNGNSVAVTHSYRISVRTATKVINWKVSSGFYDSVGIGDSVVKRPGSEIVEITQKAQPQPPVAEVPPTPVAPPTPPTAPLQ